MNLNHLRYFVQVCKYEGITKASGIIHVSQPAITLAIKDMEQELGFQLFDRVNNRVRLTPKGLFFYEKTQEMLDFYDSYYNEAIDLGLYKKTELRVGIPSILSTFLFEKIVPEFEQKNPDIRLVIHEVPTLTGLEMIRSSEIDLLVGIYDEEHLSTCESSALFGTNLVLFLSCNNPLAKEKSITKAMLADQPFIAIPKGSNHYNTIASAYKNSLNIILHSTQISIIRYMLQNNLAVAILYRQLFDEDKDICCRPLDDPIHAEICVYWKKSSYLSSSMKSFISFAKTID